MVKTHIEGKNWKKRSEDSFYNCKLQDMSFLRYFSSVYLEKLKILKITKFIFEKILFYATSDLKKLLV